MAKFTVTTSLVVEASSLEAARTAVREAFLTWQEYGIGTDEDEEPVSLVVFDTKVEPGVV